MFGDAGCLPYHFVEIGGVVALRIDGGIEIPAVLRLSEAR